MKILFLSVSTGNGHNCCARAMMSYLEQQGAQCLFYDAYGQVHPILVKLVSDGYRLSTSYIPRVYGSFYRRAEERKTRILKVVDRANRLIAGRILKLIEETGADAVVTTHLFSAQILTHIRRSRGCTIPFIGVITDYTIHPAWEDTALDYYITASQNLTPQAVKRGIPQHKIKPLGIPVDLKFAKKTPKSVARKMLGIEDKPAVLLMMGGQGYGGLLGTLKEIDRVENDFQVLAVFGMNKRAYYAAGRHKFKKTVYRYGFVENIDLLMDASDCIITKPGGLSVSESMSKGLPIVLINPIPGQEDRNVEYLVNNGIGLRVSNAFPLEESLRHIFSDPHHTEMMAAASARAGRPYAARDVGGFVLQCIRENAMAK